MPPHRRALLTSIAAALGSVTGCLDRESGGRGTVENNTTGSHTTRTLTVTSAVSDTRTASPDNTEIASETPTETPRESNCDRQWSPNIRWSVSTGSRVYPPAVADGTVYFGGRNAELHAVDAKTGEEIWRTNHDTTANTAPTILDGIVIYVGLEIVAAYDANNGRERWSITPPGRIGKFNYRFDDDGSTVYVGASNHSSPSFDVDDPYDRIYAVNRRTGEQQWQTTYTASKDQYLQPQAVTEAAGRVFVTAGKKEGFLIALNADDGNELWRHPMTGGKVESPVATENTVYQVFDTSDGPNVVAFDATSGTRKWTIPGARSPAITANTLYTTRNGVLRAFNVTSGQTRWELKLPGDGCSVSPVASDGIVYVPTDCSNERVVAVNATDGCLIGDFRIDVSTPPAIADNTLFIGGENGEAKMWAVSTP